MALAGELEIRIFAELARLRSDMEKATGIVAQSAKRMDADIAMLQKGMAALGISLSAGAFVAIIRGAIDAADHLNDLSKSTGLAVEQLAGLRIAAKQSGSDLDSIAASINKLSVNIGQHGEKFKALGISTKDPLEAFKQFADIFAAIQDPQLRAALGAEALGKAWAGAAPLLAEGGAKIQEMVDKGARMSGITAEMARQADEFNDKMALLTGTHGMLHREISALLPLLNTLLDDLFDLDKKSNGASDGFNVLLETFRAVVVLGGNVQFVFQGMGREIGAWAAQLVALGEVNAAMQRFDLEGALSGLRQFKTIRTEVVADAEKARAAFDQWERSIMNLGSAAQIAAAKLANLDSTDIRLAESAAAAARVASKAAEDKARALLEFEKRQKEAQAALEKWLKEEERLRKLGEKGWVEYAQAIFDAADAENLAMEKIHDARNKAEAALSAQDLAGLIKAFEELQDAEIAAGQAAAAGVPSYTQTYDALKKQTEQMEFELTLIGLSNAEREKAVLLRNLEAQGINTQSGALKDFVDRMKEAIDIKAYQQKFAEITNSLTDAIVSAWEQGKLSTKTFIDWLKAEFAKLVLRPIVQFVINQAGVGIMQLIGLAGSGGAAASTGDASGYGSLMNLASGINIAAGVSGAESSSGLAWLQNFFTSSSAAGVGGQAGATGAGAAAFGGSAVADGAGFWTTSGSLGSLSTAGGVFGTAAAGAFIGSVTSSMISKDPDASRNGMIGGAAGSVIGAWIATGTAVGGPWGAIIGAVIGGVIAAFTDMDGPAARTARVVAAQQFSTQQFTYGMQSDLGALGIQRGSDKWFSDSAMGKTLNDWFEQIRLMDNALAARLNAAQLATARTAVGGQNMNLFFGMEEQDMDPAAFGQMVKDRYTRLFTAIDAGMGELVKNFEGTVGDFLKLVDDLSMVNEQLTKNAPDFAKLFGESIDFSKLQALHKEGETFSQTLGRLSAVFYSTNTIAMLFGKTQEQVWGAVGLATTGGREQLIEFAGGVQQLTAQLADYYSKYYTAAEQANMQQKQLTASFEGLGLKLPTSVQGFRDLVEAQDLTTESGRKTFAALMAIAPSFYDFSQQVKGLDGVLYDAKEALANQKSLWDQFATPAQKLAKATEDVNKGFAMLGLTVPKSREEMADLIDGIDTSTKAGRDLVDALRALAPALGIVFDQVNEFVGHLFGEGLRAPPTGLDGGTFGPRTILGNKQPLYAGPDEATLAKRAEWQEKLDLLEGKRTQNQIDHEHALQGVTDETTRALIDQYYAQMDAADAAKRAASELADFGASMDKLHGNNAYSQQIAQWNAGNSMAAVTAAMPWIADLNQLMTMSHDDFTHYSDANRRLILDALRAAGALKDLKDGADKATTVMQSMIGTQQQATRFNPATGKWELIDYAEIDKAATASTAAADATKLLTDRLSLQAQIAELTGDKVLAAAVLEQQRAMALEALDPTLRELQTQLWGLQDAAKAAAAAAEITNKRNDLQIQLLRALGQEEEAVALERKLALEQLPAELRDLQQEVWAALDAQRLREATKAWTDSLEQFLKDLRLDSTLSPLTARQRFDFAEQQYIEDLLKAQGGDEAARGRYTSDSQKLLQEALAMFGRASPDFIRVFNLVESNTEALLRAGMQRAPDTVQDVLRENQRTAKEQTEAIVAEMMSLRKEVSELRRDRLNADGTDRQNAEKLETAITRGTDKIAEKIEHGGDNGNLS